MSAAKITQKQLDKVWEGVAAGWSVLRTWQETGLTQELIRVIKRENRRFIPAEGSEAYRAAVQAFCAQCDAGVMPRIAAHDCGLTWNDARIRLSEHQHGKRRAHMRRAETGGVCPRQITASVESDEWWMQNQKSFVRGMLDAHPELGQVYARQLGQVHARHQ